MTHRRTAFVVAGLGAVALAAALDRDVLAIGALPPSLEPAADGSTEPTTEPSTRPAFDPARERLHAAATAWRAAADGLARAAPWPAHGPDDARWADYLARRERATPAFRAGLERALEAFDEAAALDPEDGAADVLAGFVLLDLSLWPARASGEGRALGRPPFDPRAVGRLVQVRDAARLEEALARFERGLERPRLTFDLVRQGDPSQVTGQGLERLAGRLHAVTPDHGAGLAQLSLRDGAEALLCVAHRFGAADEAPPERPLRLARRLGLRLATRESGTLFDLLVAQAILVVTDRAWVHHAAEAGDGAQAAAAAMEALNLERRYSQGLMEGVDAERLGALDQLLVPLGGWGERFDPDLGRTVDHATAEAVALWALLAAGALGLAFHGVLLALRPALADGPPAASWTLGDLLTLVLGSFGASAALVLALTRLHPARATFAPAMLALHLAAAVAVALWGFPLLLRRAALAKHGLAPASTARARLGLGLLLGALVLATGWVGPSFELGILAAALGALGALLVLWAHRLGGLPAGLRAGVRRYERRAALSALGASLVLVAAVDLGLVRGRRLALTDAYGDQTVRLALNEAEWWCGGALRAAYQRLLREAPDRPDGAAR